MTISLQLAQVNVAQLRAPLDSVELADFVANLDPVNALADAADGFVWRLQSAYAACWWVPAGHLPDVAEAEDRVLHVRTHGPSSHAFTLQRPFTAAGEPAGPARAGACS
ncbi:DUF3291 domain-containing protein [Isoptericola chiayiensis]|uniref:DUF3291 domain-containing protein n=1 Tax=Isoptericola chiayiensis TaxID=579446 RepID=UPI0031EEDF6B